MKKITGTVQSGFHDANRWLKHFSWVYTEWLGAEMFPGSLNIDIGYVFDWHDKELVPFRRRFSLLPYGGERDIFMIPCSITSPDHQSAWLWTTTNAADNRPNPTVIELIAHVGLRAHLGLVDGSKIEIQYPEEWANKTPAGDS
jgi:CTP-dependent riboflavin kinase